MWWIYERKVVVLTWGGLIFWKYLEIDMKMLVVILGGNIRSQQIA